MNLILDAYNVIHKIPELEKSLDRSLQAARQALIERCARLREARGDIAQIYLVFDGKSEFRDLPGQSLPGVKVIFSDTGETADDRIFLVLEELRGRGECRVASDDNSVINHARAHGVKSIRVREFALWLRKAEGRSMPGGGADDGESETKLNQKLINDINEHYRRELGL